MQSFDLRGQETRRLHGRLLPIVQVACQQQCIHLFVEAEFDQIREGAARGVADQIRQFRIPQRQ